LLWNTRENEKERSHIAANLPVDSIRKHFFGNDTAIMSVAAWAWGWIHIHQRILAQNPQETLDALLMGWLGNNHPSVVINLGIGLRSQLGLPRASWTPSISEAQIQEIKAMAEKTHLPVGRVADRAIILMVAFHARNVLTDEEIAKGLAELKADPLSSGEQGTDRINDMLESLGSIGRKYRKAVTHKRVG
jgi:hypothetical protein